MRTHRLRSTESTTEHRKRRRGISRNMLIIGGVLWAAAFLSIAMVFKNRTEAPEAGSATQTETAGESTGGSADDPVKPGETQQSVKLGFPARELPQFEFKNTTGGTVSRESLKGKRWVASFVFSRCTTSCPMITAAVMKVHDRVKKDAPNVHFVSISVDPKYDTVEVFGEYAKTFTRGDHSRWSFLTGSQQEIYELVVKGFGLYVKENLGDARMPGFEVAHSNRVVLVNEEGTPVGTFLGTREEDMVKLSRILRGKEDFPKPGPGLSFSRPDGAEIPLQFELAPVEDDAADEDSKEIDANSSDSAASPDDEAAGTKAPETDAEGDSEVDPQQSAVDQGATIQQVGPRLTRRRSPVNASLNVLPAVLQMTNLIAFDTAGDEGKPDDTSAAETEATQSAAGHNAAIDQKMPEWAKRLPPVNASLNTLAAILLMAGLFAIKRQKKKRHRNLMIAAFLTSAAFLACYLAYHYALGEYTGEHGKRFTGEGFAATAYQLILWPHIILAVFVPFLAIRVFWLAFQERWEAHKKLAKITFPIWMFVSVTGVVIYGMLYHWPV